MEVRLSITDNDKTWKKIREAMRIAAANKTYARAGVLERTGAKPHGRTDTGTIAVVQEFGNDHVPSRSFMREPFDANRSKYLAMLAAYLSGVYAAQVKVEVVLLAIAREMAKDMRAALRKGIPPKLKRRAGTPLLVTRQLHNGITGDVVVNGTPRSR